MSINKEILRVAVLNILNEEVGIDEAKKIVKGVGDMIAQHKINLAHEKELANITQTNANLEAAKPKGLEKIKLRAADIFEKFGKKFGAGIDKIHSTGESYNTHSKNFGRLGRAGGYHIFKGGLAGAAGAGIHATGEHINKAAAAANKAAQHAADSKISLAHAHNMNMAKHAEDSDHSKRNALVASGAGAAGIGALALHRKKK